MTPKTNGSIVPGSLDTVVEELCAPSSYEAVYHRPLHDQPMPSVSVLADIVNRLRSVLFPGYYGKSDIRPETMRYHIGASLDRVADLLQDQVKRGHCFFCTLDHPSCEDCDARARDITESFLKTLPQVRAMLATDVDAAFRGDPASVSPGETVFCYPSITALLHYRLAHELHHLGVDLIPRIITEMAHSKTGIDIHPGAEIDRDFFIDHGTGVVIGETCVIGRDVRIYQGVTLGAKSFPKDEKGQIIKGLPRHPVVEDNVTIYSGATILGRVTIGKGAVIGGNVWITRDVPPGARILQRKAHTETYIHGGGI